ncbi:MAG: IMPACT family protein [Proteobacteria bacterium]|jgi:putative IMPACT (imprinted ancient) family translation regulator|nr:IMPACT family protein [Pseudomonadota bacterium]
MITLASPQREEREVKRSRFIAAASRADTAEAAAAFVTATRDPEASHNCWAYRVGDVYRSSDDGEPGGTAGRPILAAIDAQGLDHVVVVVARFFGGVKLGAGGLARAYGGCAAACLRTAPKLEVLPTVAVLVRAPFDAVGAVYVVLERLGAARGAERYGEGGLELDVEIGAARFEELRAALGDATRGRATLADREP